MKQTSEFVDQRGRKSASYRKSFARTLQQIDLTMLVREMREDAGFTQTHAGAHRYGLRRSLEAPRRKEASLRPRSRLGIA
jgi:hypothetical protein